MENWRVVPDTNDKIYISDQGRIMSILRDERILKTSQDRKGYSRITITIDGEKRTYKVHRLVAQAFIPNPDNLPQVNHKDGNKGNNNVPNLEWISNADNAKHAIDNNLWDNVIAASSRSNAAKMQPIYSIDSVTGERRDFKSVSEAERFFNSRHISDVLNGKRNKAAGQFFYRR